MKPINFNYVCEMNQVDFPNIEYNYDLNLSMINGEIFVRDNIGSTVELSKTFTSREEDDDPRNIIHTTKTNTQRETDDESHYQNQRRKCIYLMSKTEVKREQDDE